MPASIGWRGTFAGALREFEFRRLRPWTRSTVARAPRLTDCIILWLGHGSILSVKRGLVRRSFMFGSVRAPSRTLVRFGQIEAEGRCAA